jgi:tRNA A37 threonylcarbamoyladenosine synthetase subunit TsaC/SUA5/YrdC
MLYLLPTDTCYGFAWEFNSTDYHEIYRLKWRDFTKQLAILVEDYEDMKTYIEITDEQIEFLRNYPYSWSFLGKRNPDFMLPGFLDAEKYQMISIRVAENCIPQNLQVGLQYPLFLTSANISGKWESKTLAEAREYFPWVKWVDGGVCDHLPSDIFSIWDDGELIYLRRNYPVNM